ncbi:hypothetical protein CBR_g49131 [Chara braunii]|uniref:Uncharacterized protein n=1 Tax=Chara braunii TaxID=69332 RepID=A0A388K4W9_CHABU|nr:hypothetical protein CBR_g49131 [Chara braunii]|eukprot:GBG65059.1 hypothetical protein CBR_g49131 [Chara braunii]
MMAYYVVPIIKRYLVDPSTAYDTQDVKGPQTVAFNLPNDERIVKKRGTAMVILKNVSQAKFVVILKRIADVCITDSQKDDVTFDAFFIHTLCHECVHGIGPHSITTPDGKNTTVRKIHPAAYLFSYEVRPSFSILANYSNRTTIATRNWGMVVKAVASIEASSWLDHLRAIEAVIGICISLCAFSFIAGRMYPRGRSGKIGSRRGKWSNCGRYWMEGANSNQFARHQAGASLPYSAAPAPITNPPPPGVQYYTGGTVLPPPRVQVPSVAPGPTGAPVQYHPAVNQWSSQPWVPPHQQSWQGSVPWYGNPPQISVAAQAPVHMPVSMTLPQEPPAAQANPQGFHGGHGGSSASSGGGKGSAANNFPGPGNRAYLTMEYMEILENIKSSKAIEEARKKVGMPRIGVAKRSCSQTSEPQDQGSRDDARSSEKSEDMKVWVTTTLGKSLKLINSKLEAVDKKSKLDAAERDELERLRKEVQEGKDNKELSSNEKRKRCVARTPIENSPSAARAKPRSKGSSKTKSKRIELSDDEGPSGTKQNLQAKLDSTSSELSDIKRMLASLMSSLQDPKWKAKVVNPGVTNEPPTEGAPAETVVAQNAQADVDDEDPDEDGFAAYMKVRADFYGSLHYTRVQELCKEREVEYFKKDVAVWELARLDLQEYADSLKEDRGEKPCRKETSVESDHDDAEEDRDKVKGN